MMDISVHFVLSRKEGRAVVVCPRKSRWRPEVAAEREGRPSRNRPMPPTKGRNRGMENTRIMEWGVNGGGGWQFGLTEGCHGTTRLLLPAPTQVQAHTDTGKGTTRDSLPARYLSLVTRQLVVVGGFPASTPDSSPNRIRMAGRCLFSLPICPIPG